MSKNRCRPVFRHREKLPALVKLTWLMQSRRRTEENGFRPHLISVSSIDPLSMSPRSKVHQISKFWKILSSCVGWCVMACDGGISIRNTIWAMKASPVNEDVIAFYRCVYSCHHKTILLHSKTSAECFNNCLPRKFPSQAAEEYYVLWLALISL